MLCIAEGRRLVRSTRIAGKMVPNSPRIRPGAVNTILSRAEGDDLLTSQSAHEAFKSELSLP